MRALILVFLLFGCAHKNRLDCIDLCKKKGLRYVEIVPVLKNYDTVERESHYEELCGCE